MQPVGWSHGYDVFKLESRGIAVATGTLPGAVLLAGCATAASEQSAHKPSGISFDADAAMAADTCGKTKPSYINKHEMERVLVREYPALLRDRGGSAARPLCGS